MKEIQRQGLSIKLDKHGTSHYVFEIMPRIPGNALKLGLVDGTGRPLEIDPERRSTHLYICGSTGTGKSKMLESLIRQDIGKWHRSKCGLLVLDPHGSLYDGLINWIAWNEPYLKGIPIVPIDLRQTDWTVGYNVIRPRAKADPAVIVSNFVQAMSYVWGVDGTDKTPLFARIGSNVLWTLYEKKMTLLESEHLIDRTNKRLRFQMTAGLSKRSVAQDWEYANALSPRDFDAQISSTVNRFHSFLHNEQLRLMFGQSGASLDLGKALEQGSIILVNLSTEGARVSEEDSALFATLLLSDLWTAAKERGKGTDARQVKPFYVYIDEFQNFVTPTIAKNLDQARGFGLHLTLANQFPRQILHTGANGQQVYDSVIRVTRPIVATSMRPKLIGWKVPLLIGLLLILALIVDFFFFDKAAAKREAQAQEQRQAAADAEAKKAAEKLAQDRKDADARQQRAEAEAESKRQKDEAEAESKREAARRKAAEEAVAEHARFLTRNLNSRFARKQDAAVIGVAVESEKGTVNPTVAQALAQRLGTNSDLQMLNSFFNPDFVAQKYVSAIISGDTEIFQRLELTNWLDGVLVGRQSIAYSTNAELANTITANLRLEIMLFPVAMARESQSWAFSANGVGFNAFDARQLAEDRLIHRIASDPSISLSTLTRRK